ncbi:MAG: hypothetical protein NVSMB18_02090 [Acetobacteraceae bacterium]
MPALSRATLAFASTLPLLSGCGGSGDSFPPPCPRPSILRDANDLSRYRGGGRDLTDNVLTGRITGLSGSCKRDGSDSVVATVSVGIDLTRGPAAPSRIADIAYFVAVSEGDQVLDKQVFTVRAEFPSNTDRLRLSGDSVDLRLPVTEKKTAAAYQITVGFQLSPAELEVNRRRGAR